jgi:Amt family ammonium transporter
MAIKTRRKVFIFVSIFLLLFAVIGSAFLNAAESTEQTATTATAAAASAPSATTLAEKANKAVEVLRSEVDWLWTCIAAFLVFFMQAGFAMVEAGFTRSKNALNIIMKNLMDFSIGTLAFWIIGFGLMFGKNTSGFIGKPMLFMGDYLMKGTTANNGNMAFFIFQLVFAATAATIVSGAMAERTKFKSYLLYSVLVTALVYPIFGSWAWNGLQSSIHGTKGWLEKIGFLDFAGSTVVHSVGGWLGLAGAIVLGPRLGKFEKGKVNVIPGHNLPLAALGVFILWLGWFGFNPGSTTSVGGGNFAMIAVNTNAAAAAGSVAAMFTAWIIFKKADGGMALNGALAGLVAITAGCDGVTPLGATIIGLLAGIIVVFSVILLDKMKIDDPVGAVSVHGVCGAFGTLMVGFFNTGSGLFYGGGFKQFLSQFYGVLAAFVWAFGVGLLMFFIIKKVFGLRVSEAEEIAGLDYVEHGANAYGDFKVSSRV